MNLQIIKFIDRQVGMPLCRILRLFTNSSFNKNAKIKKILFIKFSGFGNIVLALPTIRAIKKKYHNAKIFFLTHSINKAVIEKDPSIDKILTFDVEGAVSPFLGIPQIINKIRKEHFDLIIDFEQFSRFSSIISVLSGAKIRVGFDTEGQGREMLYNVRVPYNNEQHTSKTFSDLASSLGVKVNFTASRISITPQDKATIDDFFKSHKINSKDLIIGIHPGCGINNPQRKWPGRNFARLADFLIKKYNAKILFTGGSKEKELISKIQSLMKNPGSIDTSGRFNLRELSELISRCRLFFSNDTGPLHLCSAMKTSVAAFFGPNTPKLYGPLGDRNLIFYKNLPCSPCTTNFNEKSTKCKHFKCIKNITFKEVKTKIEKSKILQ